MNTSVRFFTSGRGGALAAVLAIALNTGPVFAGVPLGTYAAFEDLAFPGSDFNYDDESLGLSKVAETAVPEPAALLLFGAGLFLVAMRIRRRAGRQVGR